MKAKLALWALAAGVAGCAAPAPHYYSLQGTGEAPAAGSGRVGGDYAISMQPVIVPQQVARPQIVVSMAEGSEVVPLTTALWAGPLEAQIRTALAGELARRLNVVDIGSARVGESLPVWRIYLDVQRFDSLYGREIQQDVVWRMVPQSMPKSVTEKVCSAQVRLPVGTGMSALVEGHRRAVAGVAQAIASALPESGRAAGDTGGALPEGVVFKGCVA